MKEFDVLGIVKNKDIISLSDDIVEECYTQMGRAFFDKEKIKESVKEIITDFMRNVKLEMDEVPIGMQSLHKAITISQVEGIVARHFSVGAEKLHKRSRKQELTDARQLTCFIYYLLYREKPSEIGKYYDIDRSTVSKQIKKWKELYNLSIEERRKVDEIMRKIKAQYPVINN